MWFHHNISPLKANYLLFTWKENVCNHPSLCRERNDLAEILALLKTQIDPALLTKKDQEEGPSPEDGENKKKGEEGKVVDKDYIKPLDHLLSVVWT